MLSEDLLCGHKQKDGGGQSPAGGRCQLGGAVMDGQGPLPWGDGVTAKLMFVFAISETICVRVCCLLFQL